MERGPRTHLPLVLTCDQYLMILTMCAKKMSEQSDIQ